MTVTVTEELILRVAWHKLYGKPYLSPCYHIWAYKMSLCVINVIVDPGNPQNIFIIQNCPDQGHFLNCLAVMSTLCYRFLHRSSEQHQFIKHWSILCIWKVSTQYQAFLSWERGLQGRETMMTAAPHQSRHLQRFRKTLATLFLCRAMFFHFRMTDLVSGLLRDTTSASIPLYIDNNAAGGHDNGT